MSDQARGAVFPDFDTSALAEKGFRTEYESFGAGVESCVKSILMDAILALVAGVKSLPEAELRELAPILEREPGLYRPVFQGGVSTSLEMSGFINGYCIRYADLCDTRRQSMGRGGHPADMVAALLALCDAPGVQGKKVLEAINLGYHLWAVIYGEMLYKRTELDGTTALALTVPVITAAVLGESTEQMQNTLCLSAASGAISVEIRSSRVVTNMKCGATGYALARAFWCHKMSTFLRGTPTMFTGAKGWGKLVAPFDAEPAAYSDDEVYGQIQFKAFPCCNANQVATEGAVRIHQTVAGRLDDIRRIHIKVCKKDSTLAIRPGSAKYPTDHSSADHHIQYCTAIGLAFGALAPKHYDAEYMSDETVRSLIDRTEVTILPDAEFEALGGENGAGVLEVYMDDGTVYTERISRPCGLYTGMSAVERAERMRETVKAKQTMIEQSYGCDFSAVADIVSSFENHSGRELIDAILAALNG